MAVDGLYVIGLLRSYRRSFYPCVVPFKNVLGLAVCKVSDMRLIWFALDTFDVGFYVAFRIPVTVSKLVTLNSYISVRFAASLYTKLSATGEES